jgi:cytochrome P450
MATATTEPVRLPPGPRVPKTVQGIAFLTALCEVVPVLGRRYGGTFTINLPVFGKMVVISDPILVKDAFSTSSDLIERPTNLGHVFGPGSTFSLNGEEHAERRKLVLPAFHAKRVKSYERIVEEEVMRETATWPRVRNASDYEPADPQRDPACRLRRRRTRTGRTSQPAAGHDPAWRRPPPAAVSSEA